jgi:hypothetical protein
LPGSGTRKLRSIASFSRSGGFELSFVGVALPDCFSEFERAASAVLAHRFLDVPSLGDVKYARGDAACRREGSVPDRYSELTLIIRAERKEAGRRAANAACYAGDAAPGCGVWEEVVYERFRDGRRGNPGWPDRQGESSIDLRVHMGTRRSACGKVRRP